MLISEYCHGATSTVFYIQFNAPYFHARVDGFTCYTFLASAKCCGFNSDIICLINPMFTLQGIMGK